MTAKRSAFALFLTACIAAAEAVPAASITGLEDGWKPMLEADFENVNCSPETWSFDDAARLISCTGQPIGVMRSVKEYKNFELVLEWMHEKESGNSGVFVWTSKSSLEALIKPGLPDEGIEVQVLDPGFKASYEKSSGKPGNWFTCHGDVFPVRKARMTPFPPLSPDGVRSFPSAENTKPHGEWNHYYIRAINGEIRLWVNGVELSGGKDCQPNSGYLCLESEGSPIKFRNLRIRELP
ncbi:DUF1080 domain-containing protein [Akkermansiaceae bacterium]|nr:DUF1080 domain-containing protein [Akkermansiaceae bacterium]